MHSISKESENDERFQGEYREFGDSILFRLRHRRHDFANIHIGHFFACVLFLLTHHICLMTRSTKN